MKNLKFRKLLLLSRSEKKALIAKFDERTTVIFGENDTGKSHLIKSVYGTLGADASVINEKWHKAAVVSLLEFSIQGISYSMLRHGNQFACFDELNHMLWTANSLVKEVGPKIAEMLDFNIQLPNKSNELIVPPPQFCFLPFYQDQDRGWDDTWASFKNLSMLSDFKKSILEYHTGIRPKEYYAAKAQRSDAIKEQYELSAERRALDRASARLLNGRSPITVTFEPELFEFQIRKLMVELNELRKIYNVVKSKISDLQTRRALLVEEIEIARVTLVELDADVRFTEKIFDAQVVCPTCNTIHENDFANRFSLISDADTCREFLASAQNSLTEVEEDISRQMLSLRTFGDRIDRINDLLDEQRGEIKLRDMLKDESERIVDATIYAERGTIDESIIGWKILEQEASALMRSHSSIKTKSRIVEFYSNKLNKFALELGVDFGQAAKKSVSPKINETGSYGPRAMLAYHFALLHTIQEFTTSCLCPVVIDTPLQQDQDEKNASSIISFALKNRPHDMQLILGTVSLHGAKYSGHSIQTISKYSLLKEEEFTEVNNHIQPLIVQMFGYEQGELL